MNAKKKLKPRTLVNSKEKLKPRTLVGFIKWAFVSPHSPACYSSLKNVHRLVLKKFPNTRISTTEYILQRIPAFTLHRKRRVRFRRLKTVPTGFMSDVQVDLADMQKLADENDNFKYILVGADVLSRRIFAAPVRSKESKHMIAAFNRLFRQMPALPQRIFSDKGVEFQARLMKQYFRDKLIHKHVAQSPDVKAAIAERFVQTLKSRLYKYFSIKETSRWVDFLPHLVDAINRSVCRITRLRPIDINFENGDAVWEQLYGDSFDTHITQRPKFQRGDKVRIAKEKTPFDKMYLPNYSEEIYRVKKLQRRKLPTTYELVTKEGVPITGKFYNEELSRTKFGRERRLYIDKVLDERQVDGRREILVKWRGQPTSTAAWIRESDIMVKKI